MVASGGETPAGPVSVEDLVAQCEKIAAASGGVFGIGKVSAEERAILSRIASDLSTRRGS
jgi:hypothetical protein